MARQAPLLSTAPHLSSRTMYGPDTTPRSVVSRSALIDAPPSTRTRARCKLSLDDIPDVRLADTLALVLSEFCEAKPEPAFPDPHDPAALFFSPYKQKNFTLSYYCRRLLEYNCCSKSCLVVAILYLFRLAERYPIFELNDYNVHRLICTAVVLAAKWLDDVSYSNSHYAKVGGIQSALEMSKLEEHMLKALDYRLFVTSESFEEVESQIVQIALTAK